MILHSVNMHYSYNTTINNHTTSPTKQVIILTKKVTINFIQNVVEIKSLHPTCKHIKIKLLTKIVCIWELYRGFKLQNIGSRDIKRKINLISECLPLSLKPNKYC